MTGSSLAPSYYLMLLAVFSAVALFNSQRRVGR
jgi:MHS family proline/betaine transporter-like MFS transporter